MAETVAAEGDIGDLLSNVNEDDPQVWFKVVTDEELEALEAENKAQATHWQQTVLW